MSDNFGRSDVSLYVCLTCNLYVVSIFLCNSSVEHGFCVFHVVTSVGRKLASTVRQIYDVPRPSAGR